MTTRTTPRPVPWWRRPRLRPQRRVVGGVAGAVADEIGVDPLVVRVAFVVLLVAGGWGAAIYVVLWVLFTVAHRDGPDPGPPPAVPDHTATEHLAAVALITTGLLLGFRTVDVGFIDTLVWPVAFLGLGLVVTVARTGVDVGRLSGITGDSDTRGVVFARVAAGIVLAIGGFVALLAFNLDLGAARDVAIAVIVITGGVALVLGPWLWRLIDDLGEERRRRIRADERSEIAAQLHDSVLQTLALIQRHADDPATTAQLARRQERDLRGWLYGDGPVGTSDRLSSGLRTAASEVEDRHRTPIEVVVVGDAPADERIAGLVAAAREAMVNASRHSGSARIDVYAEVTGDEIEVYVRDTGSGFDPAAVDADRRGLADSIRGRLHRLGGRALVHTEPGEGTEIELVLPLTQRSERP